MTIKALRYRPRLKEIRRLARSEAFGVSPGAVARASTGLVDGTRFDPEHENPVPDRAWLLVSARAALREAYRAHMKGDGRKHNKSIENFGHHLAAAQLERHLAGRRKPRQAHMPALDSWIGEALNRHPDATPPLPDT